MCKLVQLTPTCGIIAMSGKEKAKNELDTKHTRIYNRKAKGA